MLFNDHQNCDRQQRFGIRKLSVGVCSVLLATLFLTLNDGQTVKADTDDNAAAGTDQTTTQLASNSGSASTTADSNQQQNNQATGSDSTAKQSTDEMDKTDKTTTDDSQTSDQTAKTGTDDTAKVASSEITTKDTTAAREVDSAKNNYTWGTVNDNQISKDDLINSIDSWTTTATDNGLKITGNKYYDNAEYSDGHVVLPNTQDFINAGKLTEGQTLSIDAIDFRKVLNHLKPETLKVSDTEDKDGKTSTLVLNGGALAYGDIADDWAGWSPNIKAIDISNLSGVTNIRHAFENSQTLEYVALPTDASYTATYNAFSNVPKLKQVDNLDNMSTDKQGWAFPNGVPTGSVDLSKITWGTISSSSTLDDKLYNSIYSWTYVKTDDGLRITGNVLFDNAKEYNKALIIPNAGDFVAAGILDNEDQIVSINAIDLKKTFNHLDPSTIIISSNGKHGVRINYPDDNNKDLNQAFDAGTWDTYSPNLKAMDLSSLDINGATNLSGVFNNLHTVEYLNVSNWNTSSAIDMSRMFTSMTDLRYLDVSGWDTSNVTNMQEMFANPNLNYIKGLNNWNTHNVTNMSMMFNWWHTNASGPTDSYLDIGDLSNWDTSNVTDFHKMFMMCDNLTSIGDLSNWNTSKATDMEAMFYDLAQVDNLGDIGKWNVSKVQNFFQMFDRTGFRTENGIKNLAGIKNWDVSSATNMDEMFYRTRSASELDFTSWNPVSSPTVNNMFQGIAGYYTVDYKNGIIRIDKGTFADYLKQELEDQTDSKTVTRFDTTGIRNRTVYNEDSGYIGDHSAGGPTVGVTGLYTNDPELVQLMQPENELTLDKPTRTINVTEPDGTKIKIVQQLKQKVVEYYVRYPDDFSFNIFGGDIKHYIDPDKSTYEYYSDSDQIVQDPDGTDYDYAQYTLPVIPGYSAYDTSDSAQTTITSVEQLKTKPNDNITVNIAYKADPQTGKISYVDPDGNEVASTALSGKTGDVITITPQIPAGWEEVPGQNIPTTVTATATGIPTVTIKIQHKQVVVTPDDPKTTADPLPDNPSENYPAGVSADDLNKTVTRTIKIKDPLTGKETVALVQTAKLTRTATVDEVTGAVSYSDWSTAEWDAYVPQTIKGYVADPTKVSAEKVDGSTQDQVVEIEYVKKSVPKKPTKPKAPSKTKPNSGKATSSKKITKTTGKRAYYKNVELLVAERDFPKGTRWINGRLIGPEGQVYYERGHWTRVGEHALPQTGAKDNFLAIALGGLATGLSLFGLAGDRKRNKLN